MNVALAKSCGKEIHSNCDDVPGAGVPITAILQPDLATVFVSSPELSTHFCPYATLWGHKDVSVPSAVGLGKFGQHCGHYHKRVDHRNVIVKVGLPFW